MQVTFGEVKFSHGFFKYIKLLIKLNYSIFYIS